MENKAEINSNNVQIVWWYDSTNDLSMYNSVRACTMNELGESTSEQNKLRLFLCMFAQIKSNSRNEFCSWLSRSFNSPTKRERERE